MFPGFDILFLAKHTDTVHWGIVLALTGLGCFKCLVNITPVFKFAFMFRFLLILFLASTLSHIAFSQNANRFDKEKNVRLSPLPVIYYSPETRLGFGGLLAANFKLSLDSITRGSYIQASIINTLNKQYEFSNKGRIYGYENKHITEYKVIYSYFPEFFFGYQTEDPELYKELIQYNRVLLEARRFWRVRGHAFAGAYFRFNRIFNMELIAGGKFDTVRPIGYQGYHVVGVSPAFNYDSRDSQVYPTHGKYLEVLWVAHPAITGDFTFGNFRLDARMYVAPKRLKDDVLAFQILFNLNQGAVPYKDMAEIGGANITRGYYKGYFRYKNLYAVQTEYRFMISNYLGFAGWVGLSSNVAEWHKPFSHSIKPNAGGGLRIRINQHDKLNIRADYGVGLHQTGFYLDIAEAF